MAQFCMFWFHQNYMSVVYEALEEDKKVPVTQSGERRWAQSHKNQDIWVATVKHKQNAMEMVSQWQWLAEL